MPEPGRNAALQRPRVAAVFQHVDVVIAFEHQRVAAGEAIFDMQRGHAEIGENADASRAVADHILDGFARVVRHRDRHDLELADRKLLVAVEAIDMRHAVEALGDRCEGPEGRPHRNRITRGECGHPSDVVGVLVRDENCGEVARRESDPREARDGVANAETAIDQHTRRARFDDETVALAAAAQGSEAH
jgi:hypothetical protein